MHNHAYYHPGHRCGDTKDDDAHHYLYCRRCYGCVMIAVKAQLEMPATRNDANHHLIIFIIILIITADDAIVA